MIETPKPSAPGFVVLRHVGDDTWEMLEVARKRGLPARAARTQAILDATDGKATGSEAYVAVLRSEWRIALDGRRRLSRGPARARPRPRASSSSGGSPRW